MLEFNILQKLQLVILFFSWKHLVYSLTTNQFLSILWTFFVLISYDSFETPRSGFSEHF